MTKAKAVALTRQEVADRINATIKEWLGVPIADIKPESKFYDDLGADSLDAVELIMAVEDEFNIEMTDEEVEEAPTVALLNDLVCLKLKLKIA